MINKDSHYFILMRPLEYMPLLGLAFTSSSSKEKWVECKIVEDRYKLSDNYKVTLEALEEGYGREHYYQMDFESLLEKGYIIEKTSPNQIVKEITLREQITPLGCLIHSGYIIEEEN